MLACSSCAHAPHGHVAWAAVPRAYAWTTGMHAAAAPCSPYYYLASVLGAHVDQSDLWKQPDAAVAAQLDAEGGLEVADPHLGLCGLASFAHAWGLPHVLRVASKEGGEALRAAAACRVAGPPCEAGARTASAVDHDASYHMRCRWYLVQPSLFRAHRRRHRAA